MIFQNSLRENEKDNLTNLFKTIVCYFPILNPLDSFKIRKINKVIQFTNPKNDVALKKNFGNEVKK